MPLEYDNDCPQEAKRAREASPRDSQDLGTPTPNILPPLNEEGAPYNQPPSDPTFRHEPVGPSSDKPFGDPGLPKK